MSRRSAQVATRPLPVSHAVKFNAATHLRALVAISKPCIVALEDAEQRAEAAEARARSLLELIKRADWLLGQAGHSQHLGVRMDISIALEAK